MEPAQIPLSLVDDEDTGLPLKFATTVGYIQELSEQLEASQNRGLPCITIEIASIDPLGSRVNNHLTNGEYDSIQTAEIGPNCSAKFTGHSTRVELVVVAGTEHLVEIGTLTEEAQSEPPFQWTTTVPKSEADKFRMRATDLTQTVKEFLPAAVSLWFECPQCGEIHEGGEIESTFLGSGDTGHERSPAFSIQCPETTQTFTITPENPLGKATSNPPEVDIAPDEASELVDFLAEAPGDAYELTWQDDHDRRTTLATNIEKVQPSQMTLASPPIFKVAAVTEHSGIEEQQIHIDDIEHVEVVESLSKRLVPSDGRPHARAEGLCQLARVAPEQVDIGEVTTLLVADSFVTRRYSLFALRYVIDDRTADCVMAVPQLHSIIEEGQTRLLEDALYCLATLAQAFPADVAPVVDTVGRFFGKEYAGNEHAATVVMEVADEDASDILDLVPALANALSNTKSEVRSRAAFALSRVAAEDIEAVQPVTESLAEVVTNPNATATTKLNAISALGRVASDNPGVAVDVVPELAELLDADNHKLRANAAGAISDVAKLQTLEVRDHVPALASLLTDDDDYVRINVSASVARVAEDFPEAVSPHISELISCLEDSHPLVRENACWALGHLGVEQATGALERLQTNDSEEAVQTRAKWALNQIEST